ncbi:uncharacterized protein C20orf24 homolog [Lingula anatina]|uniref:Uncharacterized protein C20orf24 homolog n=1 Tax=Lingula anatina TaxID=7574 RepID=A0A1S3JLP3_LINAN|nr:uncharacterized protein C20orf24 homolog [Lingula anatina]|eukprot:XP_013410829.1 uncharacterized protein C20orf24 homolog [Lingula anatina]
MQNSARKRNVESKSEVSDKSVRELWNMAITAETEWENKDDFLDVVYWMRQILGVVLGLIWGIVPLKGFLGLALFFAVLTGVTYFFYNTYHKVDDDKFGGPSEILKEGLMTSFASFLVLWIITYSALHFD